MSKYLEILGCGNAPITIFGEAVSKTPTLSLAQFAVALGGGVAGSMLWKKHPVLGFFSGHTVADDVFRVLRHGQDDVTSAAFNSAATAAGVALSLKWKKHPAWGFVLGTMGASLLSLAIPSSPSARAMKEMENIKGDGLPPLVPPPQLPPLVPPPSQTTQQAAAAQQTLDNLLNSDLFSSFSH